MKNIFLSLFLLLAAVTGHAQARGVEISNRTECDIYLQLRGAKECRCDIEYISNQIVVPSGATIFVPNTAMLGGTFPTVPVFVHSAVIFSGPRHCQPMQTWIIGENRIPPPPSTCSYPDQAAIYGLNQGCERLCPRILARWVNAVPTCDGIARIIFTP